MEFIELSGRQLITILHEDEYPHDDLQKVGLTDDSRVRINRQGDLEVLDSDGWQVIGGLLGDFAHRIQRKTGLKWKPMPST